MRIRRRLALFTVALGVAMLAVAPAAEAATIHGCPSGYFCLYRLTNYSGGMAEFNGDQPDLANAYWDNGSGAVFHSASSMVNNSGYFFDVFYPSDQHGGCKGWAYTAQAHTVDSTFTNNGMGDNPLDNKDECLLEQTH